MEDYDRSRRAGARVGPKADRSDGSDDLKMNLFIPMTNLMTKGQQY